LVWGYAEEFWLNSWSSIFIRRAGDWPYFRFVPGNLAEIVLLWRIDDGKYSTPFIRPESWASFYFVLPFANVTGLTGRHSLQFCAGEIGKNSFFNVSRKYEFVADDLFKERCKLQ
jgi:hypothetical protein